MYPRFVINLLLLVSLPLVSQELPPIQNYPPTDYHAENQNWAISQANNKVIYLANNKGLLEFDGARWTLYPSPNESIMRSVKAVGDRIYSGCYMEFGYWKRDDFGMLRYTSLSSTMEKPPVEDEEFWGILNFGDWIVFQSLKSIYIYDINTGAINQLATKNALFRMFKVGKSVCFQENGAGLYRIDNGQTDLIYEDEVILKDEIINIFQQSEDLILITRHSGFFKTKDGRLEPFKTGLNELDSKISIYSALKLKDGTYALGTISHGLILLNSDGSLLNHIDQIKGLRNNTVLSLLEDMDNNIWLGLDNGISYMNIKGPIKEYRDNKGEVGSTYASLVKEDTLYLGTNQGLFYRNLHDKSDFKLIKGTEGQVWSLKEIDGTLFCCHHSGTYIIKGDRADKIADIEGTWKIVALPDDPNHLVQGNYDGLYVLEKNVDTWQIRNKIEGFGHSSRHFEVFNKKIFVSHEYKGVFEVEVDSSFLMAKEISVDTLIKGSESAIVKYGENLFYGYKNGILRYSPSSNTFEKETLLSGVYDEDNYVSGKMILDRITDELWLFTNSNISIVSKGTLRDTLLVKSIPLTENVRNDIVGYENVINLGEDGKYLLGTTSGYIIIDINGFQKPDFSVQIGKVEKSSKGNPNWVPVDISMEDNLKSTENHLKIYFFAPEYNKYFPTNYQYQLEGFYDGWSNWSTNHTITYENLPHGSYTFMVRAKIGDKISRNTASYTFEIAKPWYISNAMVALYILAFIIASYLIHQAYRRYYHKHQQKLIERNKREMALAKAQNEKEIIRIKNEQLEEDFKNKSNELAASTMSIIKKNELLANVKDQLVASVEDKDSVKSVIGIIDKNLKQNNDWELFKEAFNNADRKFLKKLKKEHPNLSPNDIRLCAYLRLNLSSKEIAPMFNISPRSVEIKRYRLRKKMNLSHDENLVDYILKL